VARGVSVRNFSKERFGPLALSGFFICAVFILQLFGFTVFSFE
jgi:hypothetical protein